MVEIVTGVIQRTLQLTQEPKHTKTSTFGKLHSCDNRQSVPLDWIRHRLRLRRTLILTSSEPSSTPRPRKRHRPTRYEVRTAHFEATV